MWSGVVVAMISRSMSAALVFGETLAAAVVAVMYSGGTFLEAFVEGRARREMHDLLSRVPRTATRHRNGGLEEIPLDHIAPGDRLLIRQGDVVVVEAMVNWAGRTSMEVGLIPWYTRRGYTMRRVRQFTYPDAPTFLDAIMTKRLAVIGSASHQG